MYQYRSMAHPYAAGGRTLASAAVHTTPATTPQRSPAAWGLALVEAAIGYEWLLSGLNKLLSPTFGSGLAHQLQASLQDNPNRWYVSLANTLIIPHASLFAVLAEGGEVLVGLGLFAGAILWASGRSAATSWARLLNLGTIAALVGGILMSANYAAMAGDTLPGINAANPFNEGLSIDSLLAFIGIGLLIVHIHAALLRGAAEFTSTITRYSPGRAA